MGILERLELIGIMNDPELGRDLENGVDSAYTALEPVAEITLIEETGEHPDDAAVIDRTEEIANLIINNTSR